MSASWRQRLDDAPAYADRSDTGQAGVPAYPGDCALLVYDGVCILCSGLVGFLVRRDAHARIRFTAAQSALGSALMRHYGLDPANPETMLTVFEGRALGKLDGIVALMRLLPWPWSMARALAILPSPISDWLYDRIARNRYRLFGRADVCIAPDPRWRARFLE